MNKKQQTNTNFSLVLRNSNLVLNPSSGFTIVELIVVMSIFAILAGTVIFRYKDFGASIDLQNTTQEIALKIQQAQNDAIAGKYPALGTSPLQDGPSSGWRPSYGVYFNKNYNKNLIYFFDNNEYSTGVPGGVPAFGTSDGSTYRGALDLSAMSSDPTIDNNLCRIGSSECLDLITIKTGERIAALCTYDPDNGNPSCSKDNLSIVFTRPFPDRVALAHFSTTSGNVGDPEEGDVGIRILSTTASIGGREIVVTPLGQIYIRTLEQTVVDGYFQNQNNNQN